MPRRSRRRSPTLVLFAGLTLLVVSPLGWAWLQYDLYREEESVLAELKQSGVDVYPERGAFVAEEQDEQAEGTIEIMTEQWRTAVDDGFPWLRPLRKVQVVGPISIAQAQSAATLPRVTRVRFYPPPQSVTRESTDAETDFDLATLPAISVAEVDLDVPFPSGKALKGEDVANFERDLRDAWTSRGSDPVADRYALTIAGGPAASVTRVTVDGERRKLVYRWPGRVDANVETSLRVDGDWRSASRYRSPDAGLSLETLSDGPYFYADYDSYPPYLQSEFPAFGEPVLSPSMLLAAGIEHAERVDDGAYVVRFRPFDAFATNSNGWARSGDEPRHPVEAESVTLLVRPDLDWCVERAEVDYAGARRIEWLSKLERRGEAVVVREQVYRPSERNATGPQGTSRTIRSAFHWDLDPKFADDEFTLASAGAASLGPPRAIPFYRRWYLATAAVGALLTAYASLRIVARRVLARQRVDAASAERTEPTTA